MGRRRRHYEWQKRVVRGPAIAPRVLRGSVRIFSSFGNGWRLCDICQQRRIVGSIMNKADDYRRNAADTMQLAQRASSSEDKGRLLKLAEAWLDLADRASGTAKRLRRPTILHPLVRKKLDQYME
jgi:hypothetical protein